MPSRYRFHTWLCTLLLITAATALVSSPTQAAETSSVVGHWLVGSGHGVIAIEPCGNAMCGRIVGIDRTPDEPMPTDVQGRSQCGLRIIDRAVARPDGTWDGEIYDPRSGNTYSAEFWLDPDGTLKLHGYLGISLFGRTVTWTRYTGELGPDCHVDTPAQTVR